MQIVLVLANFSPLQVWSDKVDASIEINKRIALCMDACCGMRCLRGSKDHANMMPSIYSRKIVFILVIIVGMKLYIFSNIFFL